MNRMFSYKIIFVNIENIISLTSKKTQICIFSATFTKESLMLTEKFLRNPYRITVEKENVTTQKISKTI